MNYEQEHCDLCGINEEEAEEYHGSIQMIRHKDETIEYLCHICIAELTS
jgi:hypothetical protein